MSLITVFDVGARYGIHPSWKILKHIVKHVLIEADPDEVVRLRQRYAQMKNIAVVGKAVSSMEGQLRINRLSNPAMSGALQRVEHSPVFSEIFCRGDEVLVEDSFTVETITIDKLCLQYGYPDFIKIDIEGSERDALMSLTDYSPVMGIRSEVSFQTIYKEEIGGTFASLHSHFLLQGYILLNLDYSGQGDFWSPFVTDSQRYGTLNSTDAVWIRDPREVASLKTHDNCAKYCLFLFMNNAPDIAIWAMTHFSSTYGKFPDTVLSKELSLALARHLYTIKWSPSQRLDNHRKLYESLFEYEYPAMSRYNESEEFNPV